MKTKYYTTSSQFHGFYESDYYHSDMEYDYNNFTVDFKEDWEEVKCPTNVKS